MSRIGKQPIIIPAGVEVSVTDGVISVKGKGGELTKKIHKIIGITVEGDNVVVVPLDESREGQALWGTFASHVRNMIAGVTEGFAKKLSVEGVGYKVALDGAKIVLNVGFSHQVEVAIPEGLEVVVEKNEISIKGANKETVGQFAANVRAVKKPEPYKGKGIRYSDEVVRRKEGKRAAA
ncbi:50S ribosomal protein L6 [Candidatus Kaiserbacteria bacterium]|nr:MAG: 50S ribosomal protein L6 [Candidatus Kaiserbacteria bacterium]